MAASYSSPATTASVETDSFFEPTTRGTIGPDGRFSSRFPAPFFTPTAVPATIGGGGAARPTSRPLIPPPSAPFAEAPSASSPPILPSAAVLTDSAEETHVGTDGGAEVDTTDESSAVASAGSGNGAGNPSSSLEEDEDCFLSFYACRCGPGSITCPYCGPRTRARLQSQAQARLEDQSRVYSHPIVEDDDLLEPVYR